MSDPRKPFSLNQSPRVNPKVEEFRRAPAADSRPDVDGSSTTITAADADGRQLAERVLESLQTVYDPELPVNIVDLGLVYGITVDASYHVHLTMTLTAPACPVADSIVREVEQKTRATVGVNGAKVELVWSPPWDKRRMSEAALLELGLL